MRKGQLFINGIWIDSKESFTSLNPNTNELFGIVANANLDEVNNAVLSAKNALPSWSALSVGERSKILKKVVDFLVEEYGDAGKVTVLKQLISDEMGKRMPEADIEVLESSDMLNYFVLNAEKYLMTNEPSLNQELWATKKSEIHFEPKGVVAIIKAWNYPLELPIWAIAPALITGNTVVFKPSQHSSFVAIELVKLFEKAGLPSGVLNLITGDNITGENLVNNENINMVSFTGSSKIGTEINIKCAKRHIKCSLELSGNDGALVEHDADLELTSNGLVWGAFCNSGQVCVGIKRAFINSSIFDDLTSLIVNKTNLLKPKIDFGPIVSENQLIMIEEFVEDAISKGAKILTGGERIKNNIGNYYLPTVLTNITNDMRLMNEECFGLLLPLIKVDSTELAIEQINNSRYGLGASIWTENIEKGQKIAKKIQTGMVWINDVNVAFPEVPWVGIKNSGNGIDLSQFSLFEYVNIKHINTELSKDQRRIWWYPYVFGF